jgi:hypothetical protein
MTCMQMHGATLGVQLNEEFPAKNNLTAFGILLFSFCIVAANKAATVRCPAFRVFFVAGGTIKMHRGKSFISKRASRSRRTC